MIGRLRAYVLTDEGTRLLGSAPVEIAAEKAVETQQVVGNRIAERKTKTSPSHSNGPRISGKQNRGN